VTGQERRRFQRLKLRLPISRLSPCPDSPDETPLRTSNISAGGMYFELPADKGPEAGAEIAFELTIPPGEGYASSASRIRGSGRVVREAPCREGTVGVAVAFTQPLALNLSP